MGKDGFSHISSGKAGLLFECIAPGFEVVSDELWKSITHPAFATSEGEQPNFRLSESNIKFDARFDPGNWQYSEQSCSIKKGAGGVQTFAHCPPGNECDGTAKLFTD